MSHSRGVSLTVSSTVVALLLVAAGGRVAAQPLTVPMSATDRQPEALGLVDVTVGRMIIAGDLVVRSAVGDPLVTGRTHERLQQSWRGLPVLGGEITRQRDGHDTRSVFGTVVSGIDVDTTPSLTPDEAMVHAAGRGRPLGGAELFILHNRDNAQSRLVYRVHRFGSEGLTTTLVDAHTGVRVRSHNDTKTQTAHLPCEGCAIGGGVGVKGDRKKMSVSVTRGAFTAHDRLRPPAIVTYDMRGDWPRTLDILVGEDQLLDSDVATDADNLWLDGANVDAHSGTGWFYDYLFERFGRAGIDDADSPIVSLVHPVDRGAALQVPTDIKNLFHLNAFFCAPCGPNGIMVYGEGLPFGLTLESTGQSVDFFSAGLDIVAHELGHAVTEFTSRLVYQGESGALSEAFSDLLGVGTEFFVAETGRHKVEQPDYVIGEDVLTPGGIRSLENPGALGDPDHYSKRSTGSADNGGVHTNSLIVSHAFYLAIEGGSNRTSGLHVTGLGAENRDQVEQAFYRAFVFMLPTNATFAQARAATLQSARDLAGGAGGSLEQTIATAWSAVGVE